MNEDKQGHAGQQAATTNRSAGGPGGAGDPPPDEFAGISARRGRSPFVAAAAALLALFLVLQLRKDVAYFFSSREPLDLGDARALVGRLGALPEGRYVSLSGLPDRESAVILDTRGSWTFAQFFRLLGTDSRLLVRRVDDPLPVALAERDRFAGRLLRLEELPFAASIRSHFQSHVSTTHAFAPAELGRALSRGTLREVPDLAGETVRLGAGDRLEIDVERPGELRVELPRDRFPDEGQARAFIGELKGEVRGLAPVADPKGPWTFFVSFPADSRAGALDRLGELDRRARVREARATLVTTAADLALEGGALRLRPEGALPLTIPFERLRAVRTRAQVEIPLDAWVLIEGDRPGDHFKTVVFLVCLLGFAAVNLLALRRSA